MFHVPCSAIFWASQPMDFRPIKILILNFRFWTLRFGFWCLDVIITTKIILVKPGLKIKSQKPNEWRQCKNTLWNSKSKYLLLHSKSRIRNPKPMCQHLCSMFQNPCSMFQNPCSMFQNPCSKSQPSKKTHVPCSKFHVPKIFEPANQWIMNFYRALQKFHLLSDSLKLL